MSKLASLLGGMTLNDLAREILGSQGRGGDTELAHVNKREAALLKSQGGSGTVNPQTGMTEFQDEFDLGGAGYDTGAFQPPADLGGEGYDTGAFQPPMELGGAGYDTGAFGPPTLGVGGGQVSPASQEISDIGFGEGRFTPEYGAADIRGMERADFGKAMAGIEPPAPGIGETIKGYAKSAEQLAKDYPTLTRGAMAAAAGIPGLYRAGQARREAARTRAEMEQMAAPIRQTGEQLLGAGQRGELTATQQQQIQAARVAARQSLAQRGVTSGTAAQQAENRITELAQRFAQQNIDNGVRLIGAANSYNAAAIQQAYRMNADANTMTQNYFTNLMRAFGALPTTQTTTTRTE